MHVLVLGRARRISLVVIRRLRSCHLAHTLVHDMDGPPIHICMDLCGPDPSFLLIRVIQGICIMRFPQVLNIVHVFCYLRGSSVLAKHHEQSLPSIFRTLILCHWVCMRMSDAILFYVLNRTFFFPLEAAAASCNPSAASTILLQ